MQINKCSQEHEFRLWLRMDKKGITHLQDRNMFDYIYGLNKYFLSWLHFVLPLFFQTVCFSSIVLASMLRSLVRIKI